MRLDCDKLMDRKEERMQKKKRKKERKKNKGQKIERERERERETEMSMPLYRVECRRQPQHGALFPQMKGADRMEMKRTLIYGNIRG